LAVRSDHVSVALPCEVKGVAAPYIVPSVAETAFLF
jgi:hypothetical protein